MDESKQLQSTSTAIEDNLKKALTELMVLHLLSVREHYIGELSSQLDVLSGHRINLVFPYSAMYRMVKNGYVQELPRRIAPDGRLRQYYCITEEGVAYFADMKQIYRIFSEGVNCILNWDGDKE